MADIWGKRGAELSTDQQLVRICWGDLAKGPIKRIFNAHIQQSSNHILKVIEDMGSESPGDEMLDQLYTLARVLRVCLTSLRFVDLEKPYNHIP